MMNLSANVARQPFHVAVFTFDDVLKDATRIKMETLDAFFFAFLFFSTLTVQLVRGSVTSVINSLTNCPNCGCIRAT